MNVRALGALAAGLLAVLVARAREAPAPIIPMFPHGASVAPASKIESDDVPVEPLKFYRFECRLRSSGSGFVAALWRNPDATWGRDLQGRPGDLRAEDYQPVAGDEQWQTVVFYSRAQVNATAACLRVQALDESMEVATASVTGPATADEVLAWSDSILAGVAVPAPQGTGALPRTAATTRGGGRLRIVFLGDSIMQDAANSPVDLWLEQAHPAVDAEIVTAIDGGAGMERWNNPDKFPGHDLNLQAAVIGQKPDLVLIGGISTRSADDTRAIIGRIHDGAAEIGAPTPDIALMTGPFGEWRSPSMGLDAATLLAIAEERGCGFLDLRSACQSVMAGAGDPSVFYRDAIHGSAAGKHLQGRIIAAWLLNASESSR